MEKLKDEYHKIIHRLYLKYQIPKNKIEAVVNSQARLLKDLLQRGDMESFRMPNIGLFHVKPNRKLVRLDKEVKYVRETDRNFTRLRESNIPEPGSGEGSTEESTDLQRLSTKQE